jgi:FkbM family methyltransferase
MKNIEQWFKDNGDYTLRLNYDLNKNSVVFDIGGYEGWFTEQINNKYGSKIYCFEPLPKFATLIQTKFSGFNNILVFPLAISDKNEKETIYFKNDGTSTQVITNEAFVIDSITLDKVMTDNNITNISLIKINIEGDEYRLLEHMIKNNLIEKCDNIQVQFHDFIEHYDLRYGYIKYELEKTHHLTYQYPFVWENWEINK